MKMTTTKTEAIEAIGRVTGMVNPESGFQSRAAIRVQRALAALGRGDYAACVRHCRNAEMWA